MQLVHTVSILFLLTAFHATAITVPKPATPAKAPDLPDSPDIPESPETPDSPDSPDSPLGPGYKPGYDPEPYGNGGTSPNDSPSEYSVKEIGDKLSSLIDAISSVYDIANPSTSDAASQPTITPPPPSSPSPSGFPTLAAPCSSAHSVYDACAFANSGFNSYSMTDQASCLCNIMPGSTSTSISMSVSASETVTITSSDGSKATQTVAQAPFDGYMSSCDGYVKHQTQLLTYQPVISQGAGLCAQAKVAGGSGSGSNSTGSGASATSSSSSMGSGAASTPTVVPPTTGQASPMVEGSCGSVLGAAVFVVGLLLGGFIL